MCGARSFFELFTGDVLGDADQKLPGMPDVCSFLRLDGAKDRFLGDVFYICGVQRKAAYDFRHQTLVLHQDLIELRPAGVLLFVSAHNPFNRGATASVDGSVRRSQKAGRFGPRSSA